MIRNIIFDIGGVLVGFNWEGLLKSFGFEPEKEAAIAGALFGTPVWQELDRGVWPLEKVAAGFAASLPQYAEDVQKVFWRCCETIVREAFAIPWIQSLKNRGFGVYFLSNYSRWMIEGTQDALDFLPYMDGGVFSCDVHQVKPEPDIFRSFFARYPSVKPENTVFLDDSPANIETARSFGLHTIHVKDHAQAAADLEELLR